MVDRIFDLNKIWKYQYGSVEDRNRFGGRKRTKPVVIWTEIHAIGPHRHSDEVFAVLDYPEIIKMKRRVIETEGYTSECWRDNGCHYHERDDMYVTDGMRIYMREHPEEIRIGENVTLADAEQVTKIYVKPCSSEYGTDKILAYAPG